MNIGWIRASRVFGWFCLGAAIIVPLLVSLVLDLQTAANVAQLVSIPLAVAGLVAAYAPRKEKLAQPLPEALNEYSSSIPPSFLNSPSMRRWLARRTRRQHKAARRTRRQNKAQNRQLASQVEDMLMAFGLGQSYRTIGGGIVFRVPEVLEVVKGPPTTVSVQLLPGQIPEDYLPFTERIAYTLDVAEVLVDMLGPSLIQLRLMPKTRRSGAQHWGRWAAAAEDSDHD